MWCVGEKVWFEVLGIGCDFKLVEVVLVEWEKVNFLLGVMVV